MPTSNLTADELRVTIAPDTPGLTNSYKLQKHDPL